MSSPLKNTVWGLLGEFSLRGAKIAQVVLLARMLGAEDVGRFNYGLALAGLFTVLFDFGIASVATRDLVRDPSSCSFRLYGRLKLLSSALGILLLIVVVSLIPMTANGHWLAIGLGLYLALNDLCNYVVVAYRARSEFWRETLWRSVFAVTQLGGCIAALVLTNRIEWVVVALILAAGLGTFPLLSEWRRQPAVGKSDASLRGIVRGIRESYPVAGTVLVATVYMNADVVVLGHYVPIAEVGWYSVAVKAIFGLLIMPVHYFQLAMVPVFASELKSKLSPQTRNRWLNTFALSTSMAALLNLTAALAANRLIAFLFGADFAPAAPVLVVYVLIGFLFCLYAPLTQWLLLRGKQKWTFYIQTLAAAVNIALVMVLVPRFGVWGAVIAAGAVHGVVAAGHFALVWYEGGFTRHESAWWSVIRSTAGLTLAVCTLQITASWGIASKALAVGVFGLFAYREVVNLTQALQGRFRKPLSAIETI